MRFFFLFLLLLSGTSLSAQDSTVCRVMQFYDEDSANAKEELTIVYNLRGQKISETYGRFEETCLSYQVAYTVRYTWNDTLLAEKVVSEKQKNPEKYVYAYNAKGQVITESKFVWIPDPGAVQHRPGMPAQTTSSGGKWNQVSLANIRYDDKGRKILYDATRLHDRNENMQKWEYDEQNRIASHSVFAHGKLKRKTDYTYYEGSYRCWEIKYGDDGELLHESEQGQGYQSMIIRIYTLDEQGRVIHLKFTDEKGTAQCAIQYSYDKTGRLLRAVRYDNTSGGFTTHVYNYQK